VAVEMGVAAFRWGRMAVTDINHVHQTIQNMSGQAPAERPISDSVKSMVLSTGAKGELERLLNIRIPELIAYQDEAYAKRYASIIKRVHEAENAKTPGQSALSETAAQYPAGTSVSATAIFNVGEKVDVQGTSIGKGFAGTIKRHNFSSQRASHGNSRSHNVPGSISMAQDPGRVFPGKKMSGHMGDETVTTQNLDVIRIDEARQLLMIKGAVPGSAGGFVTVRHAIKAKSKGAN